VIGAHPQDAMSFTHGFFHGCIAGLFFAAMSMGINYLYQRKSIKLFFIDSIYQFLCLVLVVPLWGL
jgi:hypothetical protein